MTNYDKGTQGGPVADRPSRGRIAADAGFLGLMAGVLAWLVAGELEAPSTWGRAGVLAYAGLTGFYLWGLIKTIRRRWAKAPVVSTPPVAYMDQNGDEWIVRPDVHGATYLWCEEAGTYPLEYVSQEFGPLTPLAGDEGDRCGSCNGIGVGGPASGSETNGRCSDCQGSGVIAI